MDPAEHASAGCMTGRGLTPACGIVSSSSSPLDRFDSASDPDIATRIVGEPPSAKRQAHPGLPDGRSRPWDRSAMRARALTGGRPGRAAVDPDVGPLAITRQNVWLDWIEAEQRAADRGQLALPSDFFRMVLDRRRIRRESEVGWLSALAHATIRAPIVKFGYMGCHPPAGGPGRRSRCRELSTSTQRAVGWSLRRGRPAPVGSAASRSRHRSGTGGRG
jgi:hypothetical protein